MAAQYLWPMTAKEKPREVVNDLSEQEAEAALHFIDARRGQSPDALDAILDAAPLDDEPTTLEEDEGLEEPRAEYERGEVSDADQIKHDAA
jgi:hypothetical protein